MCGTTPGYHNILLRRTREAQDVLAREAGRLHDVERVVPKPIDRAQSDPPRRSSVPVRVPVQLNQPVAALQGAPRGCQVLGSRDSSGTSSGSILKPGSTTSDMSGGKKDGSPVWHM